MPASQPATKTASVAEEPAQAPSRGTLLIVDDEQGPREALRVVFKDEYNLLIASNGPAAIELAQHNKIDAAVLDIRMSGMSGIEVLERLKYIDPTIEVVMLTAYETTDTLRQALRLQACDYLNKPFDVSTMRSAVAAAMSRRLLTGEIHNNADQLQELLAELQKQKIQEQITRARGDIYASIIHDINGPLTVIAGFAQLMSQRIGDATRLEVGDLEFIKERLNTIGRQVRNCVEISRRYLSFLQRQSDEARRMSVNQLLSDLQDLIRAHPSVQENEFEIRSLPEDAEVQINGTDLMQIILNLAVNAFQCAPQPHKVTVEAQLLPQPLELARFKDTAHERVLNLESFVNTAPILAIAVRDNGPGIPTEVLPQIFNPYFTTKSSRQGTGLGLNIVQRLVKQTGGIIHVRTKAGEGTTFTVYIPAARVAAEPPGKN